MTYLSRIRINPYRSESQKLLANPRRIHGAVMAGVPDDPTEERILWRLDSDEPRRPMLYVLTRSKPDWTHIVEAAGWPDADGKGAAVRGYAPLLAQIAVGRQFAFRLTANPVQNTRTPIKPADGQTATPRGGRRRSFRIGHRTAAFQLDWFLKRTERWGFAVPTARTDPPAPGLASDLDEHEPPREVRITNRARLSFRKGSGGKQVVLHTATYEGRLEITDTELFTERLLGGIGPAKAYGCGLLTLAPLPGRQHGGH